MIVIKTCNAVSQPILAEKVVRIINNAQIENDEMVYKNTTYCIDHDESFNKWYAFIEFEKPNKLPF